MASLKINPTKLEGFLRRYRPDALVRPGGGGTSEMLMLCPFHKDSTPSFSLNLSKGVGYCFSCPGIKRHTLTDTIAIFENIPPTSVTGFLKKEEVYDPAEEEPSGKSKEEFSESCGITLENLDTWTDALAMNAKALSEIQAVTGWTMETIRKFRIGYNGLAYTIPIVNNNLVLNVKFYSPNGKPKYTGVEGFNKPYLWPLENISKPGTIWVVEGEKDCILANQLGLNAVTFTSGAGSIPVEYLKQFKDRDVNIVYDIDPAGRSGATDLENMLSRVAASVRNVELPTEGLPPNGDLTDFVKLGHTTAHFLQLADMTEVAQPTESRTKVTIPTEVLDTYLEDIIAKKQFFRRVRMRVRVVSASQGGTFLVPRETLCTCSRNLGDQCAICMLNFSHEGLTLHVKPEHQEIMRLIDNNDTIQKQMIKQMLDIYPKCPKVQFKFTSFMSLYPIMLIPALETTKLEHSYVMQPAWALDLPAKENEDYLAEAVVMSHPDTQEITILCYKLDKDAEAIDEFELNEETYQQLKVFQCLQPTSSMTS